MMDFTSHGDAASFLLRRAEDTPHGEEHWALVNATMAAAEASLEVAAAIREQTDLQRQWHDQMTAPLPALEFDDHGNLTPPRHLHPVAERPDDDQPHDEQ